MENTCNNPEIEIRLSTRRRKTASARWQDGRVVVSLPAALQEPERSEIVNGLVQRVMRKRQVIDFCSDESLELRARQLADRYTDGIYANSIRWVTNQNARWGSCTARRGDIRISDKLRPVPSWVLDAVIIHELAHLKEPNHSYRFHAITNRYPRMGEAMTFLKGFSLGMSSARLGQGNTTSGSDDISPELDHGDSFGDNHDDIGQELDNNGEPDLYW